MPEACTTRVEEWRQVVGWEGLYEVSNLGRVRSLDRVVHLIDGRVRMFPGRVMKMSISRRPDGAVRFRTVSLCNQNRRVAAGVHTLVLTAFVGQCPSGLICCHNDGDPMNNSVTNLRWDTYQGNADDMVRHGTTTRGVRNAMAKLTDELVSQMRSFHDHGVGYRTLATLYGVAPATAFRVVTRESWKHIP